jgi:hypothetical protein
MAFPFIPLIAGAAIGSAVTYVLKDKELMQMLRLRGEQLKDEIAKRTRRAAGTAETEAAAAAAGAAAAAEEAAKAVEESGEGAQAEGSEHEGSPEGDRPVTH